MHRLHIWRIEHRSRPILNTMLPYMCRNWEKPFPHVRATSSGPIFEQRSTLRISDPEIFGKRQGRIPTNMETQVEVSWAVTPRSVVAGHQRFSGEDGGSMDFRNVGILLQHYAASQPRRPQFETLPPWKP